MITFPLSLGERVQQLRRRIGYTQAELCIEAQLNYSTLTKIERNAIHAPSIHIIKKLADALDVSIDELLEGI